jgi:hypothetical protein
MPQNPLLVDQLQIESGSGVTLLIKRDGDNLVLQDEVYSSGLPLKDLASVASLTNVRVVSPNYPTDGGYQTITDALTSIPTTSSATNPFLVLIIAGSYTENITLDKDGIHFVALGDVTVKNSGSSDTLTIQPGASVTPLKTTFSGIRFFNDQATKSCVKIEGVATSTLGSGVLGFDRCFFEASVAGSYTVDANILNYLHFHLCEFGDSDTNAIFRVRQVAGLLLKGCRGLYATQCDYDSTGSQPSVVASSLYEFLDTQWTGSFNSALSGLGSVVAENCRFQNVTYSGDRNADMRFCTLSDLVVDGTIAAVLDHCERSGTANGAGTLTETALKGSAAFTAATSVTVTLPVAQPDNNYIVQTTQPVSNVLCSTSNYTATTFDVTFPTNQTTTVFYSLSRQ